MPRKNRKHKDSKAYDPRQLHRDLREAGLKVISCDSNGVVILDQDPSVEQAQLVAFIKASFNKADPAAKY